MIYISKRTCSFYGFLESDCSFSGIWSEWTIQEEVRSSYRLCWNHKSRSSTGSHHFLCLATPGKFYLKTKTNKTKQNQTKPTDVLGWKWAQFFFIFWNAYGFVSWGFFKLAETHYLQMDTQYFYLNYAQGEKVEKKQTKNPQYFKLFMNVFKCCEQHLLIFQPVQIFANRQLA